MTAWFNWLRAPTFDSGCVPAEDMASVVFVALSKLIVELADSDLVIGGGFGLLADDVGLATGFGVGFGDAGVGFGFGLGPSSLGGG